MEQKRRKNRPPSKLFRYNTYLNYKRSRKKKKGNVFLYLYYCIIDKYLFGGSNKYFIRPIKFFFIIIIIAEHTYVLLRMRITGKTYY